MSRSVVAVLAILIVGCAGPPASPLPASPSAASSASAIPTRSADPASACPAAEESGTLPFDSLVAVEVGSVPGADVVTFTFGPPLRAGARSNAEVSEVRPPFAQGASGLPLEVDGTSFIWVKFDALVLFDDTGEATLATEREFRPDLPIVRHVINSEEFEGVSSWFIGYDGPSCVTIQTDLFDRTVRLTFGYGP